MNSQILTESSVLCGPVRELGELKKVRAGAALKLLRQKAMGKPGLFLVALVIQKLNLTLICVPFNLFPINYVCMKCVFTVFHSRYSERIPHNGFYFVAPMH